MNLLDLDMAQLIALTTTAVAPAPLPPVPRPSLLDLVPITLTTPQAYAPRPVITVPSYVPPPPRPAPIYTPPPQPVAPVIPASFDKARVPTPKPIPVRAPSRGELRVLVVATRTYRDWPGFVRELDNAIARAKIAVHEGEVVLLAPEMDAQFARRYATERHVRLVEYTANFQADGRGAVFMRNRRLVAAAHTVVAFWDGMSRGTQFIIDLATERAVPVHVVDILARTDGPAAKAPASTQAGDLTRILGLPTTDGTTVPDLTDVFKRSGILRDDLFPGPLKPVQSEALYWAKAAGGLVGAIGVGGGKTLTSFLLPVAMESRVSLLFVPPHLYRKTMNDYNKLRLYWRLPELGDFRNPVVTGTANSPQMDLDGAGQVLYIVSMGQLSVAASSDLMERISPDLLIVDEAHYLRGTTSARSKRVKRYFDHHKGTRAAFLSGTLTNSALTDYWHLCKWALKDGSPLPMSAHTSQVFDAIFGAKSDEQRRAEAMARGVDMPAQGYLDDIKRRYCTWAGLDDASASFAKRLSSTPGWVNTSAVDCNAGLTIVETTCQMPAAIQSAMADGEDKWQSPDGEELESALELDQLLSTLSAGFYNVWKWRGDVVDEEWLMAKRRWAKGVRTVLKRNMAGVDSPLLVENACRRHDDRIKNAVIEFDGEERVALMALYQKWQGVRERPAPDTRAVWLSDFLVKDAVARAKKSKRGCILWYENPAVGEALHKASGWPIFGAGDKDARALNMLAQQTLDGAEPPHIICSWLCHGTGKNLQGWDRSIVVQTPGRGDTVEQLLGRLHREGQKSDEVVFSWYVHSDWAKAAMAKARTESMYQERTLRQPQRLLLATVESAEDYGDGE